jgi:hypothetical protein
MNEVVILSFGWCQHEEIFLLTPSMAMGQCSETSAHKIQTPGSHPKERIQHSERRGSLKSRMNGVDEV